MNRYIINIIALLLPVMAVAADVTIVDNQPMTAVEGLNGWYKYTIGSLHEGDKFNIIFNNGGWAGGQTADYYTESALGNMCFTSNGSDITEIDCPTTEDDKAALTEGGLSVYSNSGRIYGNFIGVIEVCNSAGVIMQVIDADGRFESRQLPQGYYIVRSGSLETKILIL
ncbi:MAG: hypothetical protein MJ003_06665 [Paludibacteraceae bacterium]|nr:hypothetical protein [Paludibacteraceae bacterium]